MACRDVPNVLGHLGPLVEVQLQGGLGLGVRLITGQQQEEDLLGPKVLDLQQRMPPDDQALVGFDHRRVADHAFDAAHASVGLVHGDL